MVRINSRFGVATALVLAVPALSACGYNTIPTKQERAQAAWADVQSQYQRRADLIPNLVATVQGAAIQERTTLTQVIEARARATSVQITPETLSDPAAFQQFQAAQGQLTSALSRLLVTVEAYPQLQANQGFLQLQSQLEGTENRITIARRDYNEAVRDYNTSLRTFPTVIWAKTAFSGEEPMQLFTATAEAQSAPQVQFNLNGTPASQPGGTSAAVPPGSPPPTQ
ncbi:LemA family protein [Brevundimonas subvibrioides]|jgi:LemA protein|uniref:LemA family protein n=1 Tax=Brevundimonas subvibrioides (strain ATCC 15264 / DSM 4735 / LMG 14903 / NBRC 16000 / CB 81) TaxID=633149 RepID=D9QK08_BRESC|nr:LemA family protein [Brevundimonas subvibrioides]ADL01593.1 LemA family protein [Brevundimonas subvibrioides ATCC 15264]